MNINEKIIQRIQGNKLQCQAYTIGQIVAGSVQVTLTDVNVHKTAGMIGLYRTLRQNGSLKKGLVGMAATYSVYTTINIVGNIAGNMKAIKHG